MTIEELNAMLEAITNNPTDDAGMLSSFGKIREAFQNVLKEVDDAKAEIEKLTADYNNLKGVKTKEFFAPVEKPETDEKETDKETETDKEEIGIEDLFDEDTELVNM